MMRARGNLRLLLNANLWPEMKVTLMDGGKVLPMGVLAREGVAWHCI